MSDPTCLIGIDVAKATLDLAVRPTGETWQIPNEDRALPELLVRLRALAPLATVPPVRARLR